MTEPRDAEARVRSCYSTWGASYYDNYYSEKAAYPPVHRDLLLAALRAHGAKRLLDAGCGPASFLRDVDHRQLDVYGFDLTPEMVAEARRVLSAQGVPEDHVWEGSVLDNASFDRPESPAGPFDAAVCVGVLPHVPQESDSTVIENLRNAVRPGGFVALEARNQLFALFTLNRYSHEFFLRELIREQEMRPALGEDLWAEIDQAMRGQFRMDLPPTRKGTSGEPGYDEVLSRTHNPHVLRDQLISAGFGQVKLLFYHFHCLPPLFAARAPEVFRERSLAMEDPNDWRGFYMASAFLLTGIRS